MGIFDHVRLEKYSHRRVDPFGKPTFSALESLKDTGNQRPAEFVFQDQYALVLNIETTFWANKAQFDSHKETARRFLYAELFGDVRMNLDRLTHAVVNGSRDDALEVISDLRKAITP